MTRFVLALVLVITSAVASEAQQEDKKVTGYIESWNTVKADKTVPQVDVYLHGEITEKFGWSAFTLNSQNFAQGYAGFYVAPAKWIEMSGSLGIENDKDDPLRKALSLWVGKDKVSLLYIREHGGSGHWFRLLGLYQVSKSWKVGVHSTEPLSLGPYVEHHVGKVVIWTTYAIKANQMVVAGKLNF